MGLSMLERGRECFIKKERERMEKRELNLQLSMPNFYSLSL
jgi:hypothetical protein